MHPITVHPAWIKQYGAHTASILGFLIQRRESEADDEGWFTAPGRLVAEVTGIQPETYLNARTRLETAGVLQTDRTNPQLNLYRLNMEDIPT